jgi:hemolysin activation/secretion protein
MPWAGGQSFFGYVVHSDTTSGIVGSTGLNALGNGLTAGIRYDIPLPHTTWIEDYSHSLVLAVDRKDITNTIVAAGAEAETPITYLPFGIAYRGSRFGDASYTSLRLGATFNVAGTLNGGSERDFQINRGGPVPGTPVTGTFVILNGEFSHTVRLMSLLRQIAAGHPLDLGASDRTMADDWLLQVRFNGQWASQPQIATEQCAAGGPYTVRGYLTAERFGDHCVITQTELLAPTLRLPSWLLAATLRPYAFHDFAELWVMTVPTASGYHTNLESFGIGLRAELSSHLNAEFYLAEPLQHTDSTSTSPDLRFRVWAGF